MYRRNITPLLSVIALIIGATILYGVWLKPTHKLQSAPQGQNDTRISESSSPSHELLSSDNLEPAPVQTRLIEPMITTDSRYHETLAAIRDELEKGNLQSVQSRLENLPPAVTADQAVRPTLAILWNNLGIEQEKSGGTQTSVRTFKTAAALAPDNPVIQLNLAHAYWEQRDPALSADFLERLIVLAPDEPFPHLAIAELLRERDDLKEAVQHLDMAQTRAGKDPTVQSYLRTVTSKVRKTDQMEERLTRRDSAHFTVKFDGESDDAAWTAVQDILEEAYREIGQKFTHFPSKPIVVVLHTKSAFQSATGSPVWADGLYDPVLGRIHIPSQGALTDRAWLRRVLRHEFAHALLHDREGPASTTIPTWLNEGLAMQLSGEQWEGIRPAKRQDITLIPLPALEGAWGGLSGDAASVAYLEANSAVHYLIDRYGQHSINELLTHLKARQTLPAAMQSQLSLSYEQFQSRWLDQFDAELKRG